jgi:YggT family protein
MLHSIFQIAHYLLTILFWIVVLQVVLSWLFAFNVLNTRSPGVLAFTRALDRITGPLYRPIRHLLPDFGGLDFSPIVLIVLIQVCQMLLAGAETSLTTPTLT